MTPKEIFLELLKPDGKPERQLKQYEALHLVLNDPINGYLRGNRVRGSVGKDRWGTTILFPEDAPGATTHIPLAGLRPRAGSGRQLHRGLGGLRPHGAGGRRGSEADLRFHGHRHL